MVKTVSVLHLSTHNEECGIGKFQESIVGAIDGENHPIRNEFFPVSPNRIKKMQGAEFESLLKQLVSQLRDFDILHLQFEYSFYEYGQLQRIVDSAKGLDKRVLFTLHTPPDAFRKNLPRSVRPGMHPRSWLHAERVKRDYRRFMDTYIEPLKGADVLVVMSEASIESFVSYGVPRDKMRVIKLPVPAINRAVKSNEITDRLRKSKDDIIVSIVGFLSEHKGVVPAVKALAYLPDKYKLAIIGGAHPAAMSSDFYDAICDLIIQLKLRDRVYITGFVEDDDYRDALLRETDVCIYPYDHTYYDYVSSAALLNAIANEVPVIAYRTRTFEEVNSKFPVIRFCKSANYYELAREVQSFDGGAGVQAAKDFAKLYAVDAQATKFSELYVEMMRGQEE